VNRVGSIEIVNTIGATPRSSGAHAMTIAATTMNRVENRDRAVWKLSRSMNLSANSHQSRNCRLNRRSANHRSNHRP
jgi:hypothetical protein